MNKTCTPPKGALFLRIVCRLKSIASSKSALSILTSSMTKSSMLRRIAFFWPLIGTFRPKVDLVSKRNSSLNSGAFKSGIKAWKGSWNKEWMVTPCALSAAIPVGATTTVFLWVALRIWCNKVVFPVPALPVRKTDRWVWLMNCSA